jgi:RNA processing factor Prp31
MITMETIDNILGQIAAQWDAKLAEAACEDNFVDALTFQHALQALHEIRKQLCQRIPEISSTSSPEPTEQEPAPKKKRKKKNED